MAKVIVTSEEWGDFVVTFLLDAIVHDEVLEDNPEFRELMDNMKSKLKPQLLKYYLELDSKMRTNYKRVRKDIIGKSEADTIINVRNFSKKFPAV